MKKHRHFTSQSKYVQRRTKKREALKKAHQVNNLKRTRATVRKLEEAKQELEECYIKAQGKYIERKVEEIENPIESKQSRVVWG